MRARCFIFAAIVLLTANLFAQIKDIEVSQDSTFVLNKNNAVYNIVDYQGFLSTPAGEPVSGTLTMSFSFWDAKDAGNELWRERQAVDVRLGYFTASLGSVTPISDGLFALPRWIEVEIDGERLTPRKHVNSVAHAVNAANASALNGVSAASFYTKAQANSSGNNEIDAAKLGSVPAAQYITKSQADAQFLNKTVPNTITSNMIVDGTIQEQDLGFSLGQGGGNIAQIIAQNGLDGGGSSGNVTIGLSPAYYSGQAYDSRFVGRNQANVVTSAMLQDDAITSADIKNGAIQQQDLAFTAGTINQVIATNGLQGGGNMGAVSVSLADGYFSGAAYDSRFVPRGAANTVTTGMIRDNDIVSADIQDGSIQPHDMAFTAGDITSVRGRNGINGSSDTGDAVLELAPNYQNGSVFDTRFVLKNESGAINSNMVMNGAIGGNHISPNFYVRQNKAAGSVMTAYNESSMPGTSGIEGNGQVGVRGIGSSTGVHAEGSLYGVYAKSTSPSGYGLWVDGVAHCTSGSWGDLAEYVPSDENLQPGDVVIIDPNTENKIKRCDKANDTRVAGIVSTAPTITVGLEEPGKNKFALALAGIVPCKVVADDAILPGDLLTTSARTGYAQKAVDPQLGSIVGKALEGLSSGEGVIRVLVTLQ
jgi:hypothetical protein